MKLLHRDKLAAALVAVGFGAFLLAGQPFTHRAMAQETSQQDAPDLDASLDEYQRSGQILYHKLMGKSGWQRGQHIYYLKWWICHNDNTIRAEPQGAAPTLKGLYKRPRLITGEPVNDETVAAKIRDGGPRMPAYRHGLSDEDVADLVEYLRERCCWDEHNPPRNPRYRYQ